MKNWFKNIVFRRLFYPIYWYVRDDIAGVERMRLMTTLGHCESDLEIAPPWDIRIDKYVFIGKNVYVGPYVLMLADKDAEIHIGDKAIFGPQVRLIANDHRLDDPSRPIRDSGYAEEGGIRIGTDVWIGAGATILKGVHIGEGSVIGAGSVVTRNVGRQEVWAGNPARKIRDRFPTNELR